jgi:hypothetical protein
MQAIGETATELPDYAMLRHKLTRPRLVSRF